MDILIIALLGLIASETSYLAYMSMPRNKVDKQSLLIDTSVLIDGRILPIARSGLITAPMIIPRSVIRELQYMADKADHDKRERAREGLDMIEQLKLLDTVTVTIIDDKSSESGVDERLIELARTHGARLCTIDYNLNKAARAQDVVVVNINELSHALRIIHLPGETVDIKLVQAGQESRQAVGYLDDGTMVVVDDAKALIGQTVSTEVTRVLQTTAGKMMFAKLVSKKLTSQTRGEGRMFAEKKMTKSSFVQTRGEGRMVANHETNGSQTRGTAESRSRMFEDNKSNSVQTRGEAKGRGRMVAEEKMTKSSTVQTRNESRTFANKETIPTEPAVAATPPQTNSRPASHTRPSQRHPRNNRRRSPEDSLVDLANE